jgi:hypothetical protein
MDEQGFSSTAASSRPLAAPANRHDSPLLIETLDAVIEVLGSYLLLGGLIIIVRRLVRGYRWEGRPSR